MRYIQIPEEQSFVDPITGEGKTLNFEVLLEEIVWVDNWWRDEGDGTSRFDLLISLMGKLSNQEPSSWVELTDTEYEAFRPIATMKGKRIQPPNIAKAMVRLMQPIIVAPNKLPSHLEEAS